MTLCSFLLPPFKAFPTTTSHIKKFYSSSPPIVVCLLSFVQNLSLPSSYAIPSSWIRRLREQVGSAPLLCVDLRDLCCILFSPCTFCPCPHHRSSIRPGDTPRPGNSHHCVPCSIPTAQKTQDILQLCQETEGNSGAVHDMGYKPIAASTTAL